MEIQTKTLTLTFQLQYIDEQLLDDVKDSLIQGDLEGVVAYIEEHPKLEIKVLSSHED